MVATTFVKSRNTVLWKKLFPAIKHCKLQRKNVFQAQLLRSKVLIMNCHFTKILVCLLIISAASNFNVYKLIRWDPANTYLFKFNTDSIKKSEICSKLTIKTVERRSGIFILNFEHISHLFLMLLLFTMNR